MHQTPCSLSLWYPILAMASGYPLPPIPTLNVSKVPPIQTPHHLCVSPCPRKSYTQEKSAVVIVIDAMVANWRCPSLMPLSIDLSDRYRSSSETPSILLHPPISKHQFATQLHRNWRFPRPLPLHSTLAQCCDRPRTKPSLPSAKMPGS